MKTTHMPIRKKLLTQRKSSSTTGAKYRKWEGTNHLNLITLNNKSPNQSHQKCESGPPRPQHATAARPGLPPTVPTEQANKTVA